MLMRQIFDTSVHRILINTLHQLIPTCYPINIRFVGSDRLSTLLYKGNNNCLTFSIRNRLIWLNHSVLKRSFNRNHHSYNFRLASSVIVVCCLVILLSIQLVFHELAEELAVVYRGAGGGLEADVASEGFVAADDVGRPAFEALLEDVAE